MSYDPACYDVAKAFLEDSPAIDSEPMRERLAQTIQDTIEDFIEQEAEDASHQGR